MSFENIKPLFVGCGGLLASVSVDGLPISEILEVFVQLIIGVATLVKLFKSSPNEKSSSLDRVDVENDKCLNSKKYKK